MAQSKIGKTPFKHRFLNQFQKIYRDRSPDKVLYNEHLFNGENHFILWYFGINAARAVDKVSLHINPSLDLILDFMPGGRGVPYCLIDYRGSCWHRSDVDRVRFCLSQAEQDSCEQSAIALFEYCQSQREYLKYLLLGKEAINFNYKEISF